MRLSTAVKSMLLVVVLLLALSCAVIFWSFFTASGTDKSLSVLQERMQNLSYTYKSGNLAQGIQLENLTWNLKNKTQISAKDIVVKWNPACWRGKELCLKSASAGEVKVVVARSGKKTNPIVLKPVKLPFSIVSESLQVDRLIIENGAPKPIELANINFQGSLQGSSIVADSLKFDWQLFHVNAVGNMSMQDNYPINLDGTFRNNSELLSLPLQGKMNIAGDLLSMQIDSDLSVPYAININGKVSALTRKFPADLDIKWTTTGWPRTSDTPPVFANDGRFKLTGYWPDYDLTGSTKIHGPDIPSADAQIKGSINTKRATFNPLQLTTLNGAIDATGVFKWRNGLSWQATLNTDSIYPGLKWKELDGRVEGTAIFSGRSNNGLTQLNVTELNATGEFQQHPFTMTGNASKSAEGSYYLNGIEAKSLQNTFNVNGKLDKDSDLSLYFSFKSPEDFIPELKGDLNGSVSIHGDIHQPDIKGSASSSSLEYQGRSLKNTKFEGILRALGDDESEVKISAQKFNTGQRVIQNASVKINGSRSDHFLRAHLSSPPLSVDKIEVIGGFDEYNNWTGKANKVNGKLDSYPIRLNKPFNITWIKDNQTIALEPHCWTFNLASACMRESALIGKAGVVDFALEGLDLQSIDKLIPPYLDATGTLRSRGSLTWGANTQPAIDLYTQINDASLAITDQNSGENININFDTVNVNTVTDNSNINTKINLAASGLGQLDAVISINAGDKSYPLNGSLSLTNAQLQWLKTYAPQLSILEGNVTADAELGGTLSAPEIIGDVKVSNAAIASPLLPVSLNEVSMDLTLDGKTARINGHGLSAGQKVRFEGAGKLTEQNWESDLHIKAEKIPVQHEYVTNAVVSPDLHIKLKPDGINISGKVEVPAATIRVNSFGGNGVPLSRDVVVVDTDETATRTNTKMQHNISSRIDVVLGHDVHFEGYGLSADLQGDFTVRLSPDRTPELLGAMMVDSGTYRSYGQNLRINDGRINFVGPLEQAVLSVEAVRDIGEVMVGLKIDGSLQNPNTALFSEPPLPEEEILSYLVLGRQLNFGDDSADESQLLANAALFMGISNGRALSENVAKSLGIDDFALSASGTGEDTQVMLSGRLNNRLLVRYGVGIFNSVNTLFLRYDLAEKLYLETTQGLEKAVDLFYTFEFD